MSMKVRYDIEKEDDFHDDRSDGKKKISTWSWDTENLHSTQVLYQKNEWVEILDINCYMQSRITSSFGKDHCCRYCPQR